MVTYPSATLRRTSYFPPMISTGESAYLCATDLRIVCAWINWDGVICTKEYLTLVIQMSAWREQPKTYLKVQDLAQLLTTHFFWHTTSIRDLGISSHTLRILQDRNATHEDIRYLPFGPQMNRMFRTNLFKPTYIPNGFFPSRIARACRASGMTLSPRMRTPSWVHPINPPLTRNQQTRSHIQCRMQMLTGGLQDCETLFPRTSAKLIERTPETHDCHAGAE
jgi:hypothetical protein